MRHLSLPALIAALAAAVSASCTTFEVRGTPAEQWDLGKTAGPNYSMAIYGGNSRLLTTPLTDFERANALSEDPFTDLFVVSHGWNYTMEEAIAIATHYRRAFITGQPDGAGGADSEYVPYFMFVAWSSVTRPLQEAASSLLPFGLDHVIEIPTGILDSVLFHIPSAWKQSINASAIAIGTRFPNSYVNGPLETGREPDEGFDMPLSAVLFRVLQLQHSGNARGKLRVHCLGHSYGAKVVTLAAIEAIRRYRLEYPDDQATEGKLIESLLIFNAAFHPSETSYRTGGSKIVQPATHLLDVRRKGCVYSNFDYATGITFDLSQIVMNNQHAQIGQQYVNHFSSKMKEAGGIYKYSAYPAQLVGGVGQIAFSSIVGFTQWSLRKAGNLPADIIYHTRNGRVFSGIRSSSRGWKEAALKPLRWTLNLVHYFVPIDALVCPGVPVDQRGILRPSSQALGRSGLRRHVAGRLDFRYDDWRALVSSYGNSGRLKSFTHSSPDVDDKEFLWMATSSKDELASGIHEEWDPSVFYSLDGSCVFDSWTTPFVGAHGDLRSHVPVTGKFRRLDKKPLRRVDASLNFARFFTGSDALYRRPRNE